MSEGRSDPATYRAMSEPFPSRQAGEAAMDAFQKEIVELRVKHKITDVVVCMSASAMLEADELELLGSFSIGDGLKVETMLAHTLGSVQMRRQEEIGRLLRGKTRRDPRLDV